MKRIISAIIVCGSLLSLTAVADTNKCAPIVRDWSKSYLMTCGIPEPVDGSNDSGMPTSIVEINTFRSPDIPACGGSSTQEITTAVVTPLVYDPYQRELTPVQLYKGEFTFKVGTSIKDSGYLLSSSHGLKILNCLGPEPAGVSVGN